MKPSEQQILQTAQDQVFDAALQFDKSTDKITRLERELSIAKAENAVDYLALEKSRDRLERISRFSSPLGSQ